MKRLIRASEDIEYDYDELWDMYSSDEFIEIESDVLYELGLYIDFSAVRGDYGPIWIFSDPEHANNADMWMGDLNDALAELSFSDYVDGIISNVITESKDEWKDRYTKYVLSLID